MQDILDRRRTEAAQALRPNPTAWQQARPRAVAVVESRPAGPRLGELVQRLLLQGASGNPKAMLGAATLAWTAALLGVVWLLDVFP